MQLFSIRSSPFGERYQGKGTDYGEHLLRTLPSVNRAAGVEPDEQRDPGGARPRSTVFGLLCLGNTAYCSIATTMRSDRQASFDGCRSASRPRALRRLTFQTTGMEGAIEVAASSRRTFVAVPFSPAFDRAKIRSEISQLPRFHEEHHEYGDLLRPETWLRVDEQRTLERSPECPHSRATVPARSRSARSQSDIGSTPDRFDRHGRRPPGVLIRIALLQTALTTPF